MTARPEELLAHRGFVRAVALRLVRDEAWAADVAQQTFLAALENPPPDEAPMGGWLYRVARNLSAKLKLREARRRKREQTCAVLERVPSTDRIVEQEEVRRRVVRAVLSLEEPYRSTLLLRFYEDLPPRKVAECQSVPVETVKTRLKRGVDRLRCELDTRYGGSRKEWLTALLPVAGLEFTHGTIKSFLGYRLLVLRELAASSKLAIGLGVAGCIILVTTVTLVLGPSWADEPDPRPEPTVRAGAGSEIVEEEHHENEPVENEPVDKAGIVQPSVKPVSFPQAKQQRIEPELPVTSQKTGRTGSAPETVESAGFAPAQSKEETPYNMALVPAGKVVLGISREEAIELADGQKKMLDIFSRSVPRHTVKLDAFYCDYFEVTNAQWAEYLKRTDQQPSEYLVEFAWKNKEIFPEGEELLPVRNVTYEDAEAFARWCGKRLPSEAEWMRAAAGDDARTYAWGNEWNKGKWCADKDGKLQPVGSHPKGVSPFGIHDMTGSVWEWTSSKFEPYPGYEEPSIRIGKKKIKALPGFSDEKYVIKGGHYLAGEMANRLLVREMVKPQNSLDSLGFRCVKDVEPGRCMLQYALEDLTGAYLNLSGLDLENFAFDEVTRLSEAEPVVIEGYDYLLLWGLTEVGPSSDEFRRASKTVPAPIGIMSTNRPLEEPNLPAGTYIVAFQYMDYSEHYRNTSGKNRDSSKQEKSLSGQDGDPSAKEPQQDAQIDYPRNKNVILFINKDKKIMGYVKAKKYGELYDYFTPITKHRTAINRIFRDGRMRLQMRLKLSSGEGLLFHFEVKIIDNPFK